MRQQVLQYSACKQSSRRLISPLDAHSTPILCTKMAIGFPTVGNVFPSVRNAVARFAMHFRFHGSLCDGSWPLLIRSHGYWSDEWESVRSGNCGSSKGACGHNARNLRRSAESHPSVATFNAPEHDTGAADSNPSSVFQTRLKNFRAALCAIAAPSSVAVNSGRRNVDELAAVRAIRVKLMNKVWE